MSLFAGIYSINKHSPVDNKTANIVKKTIFSSGNDLEIFADSHFFLVKFDFGAFKESGYFVDKNAGVAAIAGEPFLDIENSQSYSRFSDLCNISEHLNKNDTTILSHCNGTYSICCYNHSKHSLILSTDMVGVRPLYYYRDNDFLYFSGCLRILEAIEKIPKRMYLKAVVEEQIFGIPLGNKTQYYDIEVLRDGQYIKCENGDFERSFYFRWDSVTPTKRTSDLLLQECYDAFKSAVICRSKREDAALSFLSAGLDSRCVVSMLNLLGKEIIAFNFSRPGEQDEIFAAQYAKHIGIHYIAKRRPLDDWTFESMISESITKANQAIKVGVKYPQLVFSGSGGSVGVGHVYMDEVLVGLLEQGKIDDAIHYFVRKRTLPKKILKPIMLTYIRNLPFNSLKQEIDDLSGVDPGRAFYLFLLRNDQRRHLHGYYENIDQSRVEFCSPFYDAQLLKIIVSAPVKPFLYHNFYHRWLHLFPEGTMSVPWQTYRGHTSCPVAHTEEYPSQWDTARSEAFLRSKPALKKCFGILSKKDFPKELISRPMILLALLLHSIRFDNYSYLFNFPLKLYDCYSKCSSLVYNRDE